MDEQSPLRVDIIGADRRMLDGLQSAFLSHGHSRYLIVNATIADALIVDLSDSISKSLWADYQKEYPGRPTVVLCREPVPVPAGCFLLQKPLDLEELFHKLDEIHSNLRDIPGFVAAKPASRRLPDATARSLTAEPAAAEQHNAEQPGYRRRLAESPDAGMESTVVEGVGIETTVVDPWADRAQGPATEVIEDVRPTDGLSSIDLMGDREDQSMVELAANRQLYLATSGYLLSNFQAALKAAVITHSPASLSYQDYTMIIDPGGDRVYHRQAKQSLVRLCRQPVSPQQVLVAVATRPDPDQPGWQEESVTATLWKIALWTYRGRLPLQTDIQSRMYLAHWPNFSRLLQLPNATRIAALWTEQPMPMGFTAKALRIPQRNVFAFYSAAYTIGLSGQARRDSDNLFQPGALSR